MLDEPRVFISYTANTRRIAEDLSRLLDDKGIPVWADFKNLKSGQRWSEELERAAKQANAFLILVGPRVSGTPWLEAEWQAALKETWADSNKVLIPIVFAGAEPPPFLRNWVSLNVESPESPLWTVQVLDALHSSRNQRVNPGDFDFKRQRRLDQIMETARSLKERTSEDLDKVTE